MLKMADSIVFYSYSLELYYRQEMVLLLFQFIQIYMNTYLYESV